jgi:coenzyme PQQ biosynthesis protein PqqD
VISLGARPRLAAKARLRNDRKTGKWLLLYPEAGLQLNATGAEVVRRCTGESTLQAIVDELCAAYDKTPRLVIEKEITELVKQLTDRGLLVVDP